MDTGPVGSLHFSSVSEPDPRIYKDFGVRGFTGRGLRVSRFEDCEVEFPATSLLGLVLDIRIQDRIQADPQLQRIFEPLTSVLFDDEIFTIR